MRFLRCNPTSPKSLNSHKLPWMDSPVNGPRKNAKITAQSIAHI